MELAKEVMLYSQEKERKNSEQNSMDEDCAWLGNSMSRKLTFSSLFYSII